MRAMAYLPYVGMPNVLAGERLVPELLQDEATPAAMCAALVNLLRDSDAQRRQRERFAEFHRLLRRNNRRASGRSGIQSAGASWLRPWFAGGRGGQGPLAGPVYAAAVILDPIKQIRGLADSKVLKPERREVLAERIKERATAWAVSSASVEEIDRLNIFHASMLAMKRAVEALGVRPEEAWIDGNQCHASCRAAAKDIRRRRRAPQADLGGVDPRQDGARRRDAACCTSAIRLRLRPAQGLCHG